MAKLQCDDNAHSSDPVPIIGLYIAGTSLVCLLLILSDVFFAFRRKAHHIPCRLFPLNSVTLTLLAIITKLPVDLTTNMPNARDQLSKLTGTTLICICMGFMAPSLASREKSENFGNLASLGIFIVTVVVNICVQMHTGVIFSFLTEHIIIMCFMFILFFILWLHIVNYDKELVSRMNVDGFEKHMDERISLIDRVKRWYVSACINSPQLSILHLSRDSTTAVGPICIMCLLVLLKAIYRSIVVQSIEFCVGVSDYGWSMWIVVITQILTIIIGTLIIAFRWLAIFHYFERNAFIELAICATGVIRAMFLGRRSILKTVYFLINFVFLVFIIFIIVPMFVISLIASWIPREIKPKFRCCIHKASEDFFSSLRWIKELHWCVEMKDDLRRRLIERCVDDMNKWMSVSMRHHHMFDMLSSTFDLSTTRQLLNKIQVRFPIILKHLSCLSMVVLVKLVSVSVLGPSNPIIKSMRDTLGEAFEIVYYIDRKIHVKSKDSKKRELARKLWVDEDLDRIMKVLISENPNDPVKSIISKVRKDIFYRILDDRTSIEFEFEVVSDFIRDQEYATIEELCDGIRQLFCEMLHHLLSQLPICVYKEVHDASFADCEERARYLTKLLCKLDPRLEDKVQWKFPDGWPHNSYRFFDGACTATAPHHEIAHDGNDISKGDEDGGSDTTTAQNVVLPKVTEQQSTDEIQHADASDNV